ncbi:endonuclease/exonuclease/phosphatase family protein [Pseudoalteromonas sp. H105]|uniref:endonuclease/exonuclease/phosphatase family protein n=1 Tax=Pseudoalteromonas sp. H105 TaxID=1348393 RepID=UPI000732212B|nr:endonuclease/exonuclease/phosphatase family protein [Pseudoalteromonas sp. H105]KTF15809.1 endonuclease [Pseudoalteromonas sp. H105]
MATFNLFNYLEPPNAFYDFEKIYTAHQWAKKQSWITDYLKQYQPDVIAFQEVFSIESLKNLSYEAGYPYFTTVGDPQIIDDFIYKRPVVAIASRYPITQTCGVQHDDALIHALGLNADFGYSRKVLRATIDLPHLGETDCYVVHLKSKRSTIDIAEHNDVTPEKRFIEQLRAQIVGGWGATVQRGSEATLLMSEIITRRESSQNPLIVMGDFNNSLSDGVLGHLLTNRLRFGSVFDSKAYLAKYVLNDAWDLYVKSLANNELDHVDGTRGDETQPTRTPTHYFGANSSVLDYILLSCEFDAGYHNSFYDVVAYSTYDRHLTHPDFETDDQSTDHAVVMVTCGLRS